MSDDDAFPTPPDDRRDDAGRGALEDELRALFAPVAAPHDFRERLKADLLHGNERLVLVGTAHTPVLDRRLPRRLWAPARTVAAHPRVALVAGALAVAAVVLLALAIIGGPAYPGALPSPSDATPTRASLPGSDTPAPRPTPTHAAHAVVPPTTLPTATTRPVPAPATPPSAPVITTPPATSTEAPSRAPSTTAPVATARSRQATAGPAPSMTPTTVPAVAATATVIATAEQPRPSVTPASGDSYVVTSTPAASTATPAAAPSTAATPYASATPVPATATSTPRVAREPATAVPTVALRIAAPTRTIIAAALAPTPAAQRTRPATPATPAGRPTGVTVTRPANKPRPTAPPRYFNRVHIVPPAPRVHATPAPTRTVPPAPRSTATPRPSATVRRATPTTIPVATATPDPTVPAPRPTAAATATATPTATQTAPPTASATATPQPHNVLIPSNRPSLPLPYTSNAILGSPLQNALTPDQTQNISYTVAASWTLPQLGAPLPAVYPITRVPVTTTDVVEVARELGARVPRQLTPQADGSIVTELQLNGSPYSLTVSAGYGAPWFTLDALAPQPGSLSSVRLSNQADAWLRDHNLLRPDMRLLSAASGVVTYGQIIGGDTALLGPSALSLSFDGRGALREVTDNYIVLGTSMTAPLQSSNNAVSDALVNGLGLYTGPLTSTVTGVAEVNTLTIAYVGVRGAKNDYLEPVYVLGGAVPTAAGPEPFNLYVSALSLQDNTLSQP